MGKMSYKVVQFLFLTIFLKLTLNLSAQNEELKLNIANKKVYDKSNNDKDLRYSNSGIWIKQNTEGIIFKSYLHSYQEIRVELNDSEGKILFEYNGEMDKLVNYNISLKSIPSGRYILNFIYGDMLVVCNIYVD